MTRWEAYSSQSADLVTDLKSINNDKLNHLYLIAKDHHGNVAAISQNKDNQNGIYLENSEIQQLNSEKTQAKQKLKSE